MPTIKPKIHRFITPQFTYKYFNHNATGLYLLEMVLISLSYFIYMQHAQRATTTVMRVCAILDLIANLGTTHAQNC